MHSSLYAGNNGVLSYLNNDNVTKILITIFTGIFSLAFWRFKNGVQVLKSELKYSMKSMEDKLLKNIEEVNSRMVEMKDDVDCLNNNKNFNELKKDRRKEISRIVNNSSHYFESKENVKTFILYFSDCLTEFMMFSQDLISDESNKETILNKFMTILQKIRSSGNDLLGEDKCEIFFEHVGESCREYVDKIILINLDVVNNKIFRYNSLTINFIQEILSISHKVLIM